MTMTLSEIQTVSATFTDRLDTLANSKTIECFDFATEITNYLKASITDRGNFTSNPQFNSGYNFDTTATFINGEVTKLATANSADPDVVSCHSLASDLLSAFADLKVVKGL
jgi:hypothetical protein